jgi:membrane protease YdiL (CAAX protease family)
MTMPIAAVLARAGLKPLYIVILYFFFVFAAEFGWLFLTTPEWALRNNALKLLAVKGSASLLALAVLLMFRDIRASIAAMFALPQRRITASDMALAFAVAYCWGIGVHSVLLKMPLVMADPGHYLAFWGYSALFAASSPFAWFVYALGSSFVVPILEEWFFRGLLLNTWRAERTLAAAIILSSLVFGILHGRTALMTTGVGVVLALVYLHYGSLWPAILVHALFNVSAITPAVANLTQVKAIGSATSLSGWSVEIALAIAFVPLAFLFWRRFRPA